MRAAVVAEGSSDSGAETRAVSVATHFDSTQPPTPVNWAEPGTKEIMDGLLSTVRVRQSRVYGL